MGTRVLAGAGTFALALMMAACAGGADLTMSSPSQEEQAQGLTLNTFITDSLEIDEEGGGPGDANLVLGNDADGSPSYPLPLGGPGTWIDWADLAADAVNHVLPDRDNPDSGRDDSAFPGSNECVGPANVLSKMDLTFVASANNHKFAYLAVQRSANTGDAGYYWLFTRKEPRLVQDDPECKRGMERLMYDISGPGDGLGGDVLIKGHFKPSAEPLLEVYMATGDADNITAVDAVNYLSGLWTHEPNGVAAAAVNRTPTFPGLGAEGIKTMDGELLDDELFAEAAVPLWVFTGQEGNVCNAHFFGSVITRSSGSGGTTPDLKDLAGPAFFNFGTAQAAAIMEPSCQEEFGFSVTEATGADGNPIASPECFWEFSNGDTSTLCDGVFSVGDAPATYGATVTVTDPVSGCEAVVEELSVDVYPELTAEAALSPTCLLSFEYTGAGLGGSLDYSYFWEFSPGVTPPTSELPSGWASVIEGGVLYNGTLTVTDLRQDMEPGACTAIATASAVPFAPLQVYLEPTEVPPQCPAMTSDAVTFTAYPSGGNGLYVLTWNEESGCVEGDVCVVDPVDGDFCPIGDVQVFLSDSSGLCTTAPSEIERWTKTTTVTATNNLGF